jgi:hypothetical protein
MYRLAIATALGLAACGGSDGGDDFAEVDCNVETRDEDFFAGIEKTAPSGLRFAIMQSVPAPPSRFENTWTIRVLDAAGAPVTGLVLDIVQFMPDHGHGVSIDEVITESTTVPGEYVADPVFLSMPAYWEITVGATNRTPAADNQVMFRFCLPS